MKNVEIKYSEDNKKMIITIDLTQDFGKSASGKTNIIATTEGNISVNGANTFLGVNCYRK
jgi:hypothetical protein